MKDRHSTNYHSNYRKKIIQEAIKAYGGKCSCEHCVSDTQNLRIFLVGHTVGQGQYGAALFLKRNFFKKGLAKVLCKDCYPVCNHSYPGQELIIEGYEKEMMRKFLSFGLDKDVNILAVNSVVKYLAWSHDNQLKKLKKLIDIVLQGKVAGNNVK